MQSFVQINILIGNVTKGSLKLRTLHWTYNNQDTCLEQHVFFNVMLRQQQQQQNIKKMIKLYSASDIFLKKSKTNVRKISINRKTAKKLKHNFKYS